MEEKYPSEVSRDAYRRLFVHRSCDESKLKL
jgi:hypothetical protein